MPKIALHPASEVNLAFSEGALPPQTIEQREAAGKCEHVARAWPSGGLKFDAKDIDPALRCQIMSDAEVSDQNPPSIQPIVGFAPGSAKVYGNFRNSTEDDALLGFIQTGKIFLFPVDDVLPGGGGHRGILSMGIISTEKKIFGFQIIRYNGKLSLHPASELNTHFPGRFLPLSTIKPIETLIK